MPKFTSLYHLHHLQWNYVDSRSTWNLVFYLKNYAHRKKMMTSGRDKFQPTGWSKETVDCNFLLTDPKISKSIITHWFLEILYREVLVFWCFNGVRCVEFCLFKHFQYRAFTAPYKAWTLQNTLLVLNTHPNPINIHTLHPYAHNHLLQVSRDNSGQQQTPTKTNRH